MSFSIHVESKKKDILFLDESPTQGLAGTTLTTEKMHLFNLTATKKKIVSACIIMAQLVIFLLIVQKLINLIQKILKL